MCMNIFTPTLQISLQHQKMGKSTCSLISDWLNKICHTVEYQAEIKTITHVYGNKNRPSVYC